MLSVSDDGFTSVIILNQVKYSQPLKIWLFSEIIKLIKLCSWLYEKLFFPVWLSTLCTLKID